MGEREEGPAAGPAAGGYTFDATGFIKELNGQLPRKGARAQMHQNENGSMIGMASQNWAKEPQDGAEAWTPDTRMHVASLSKIVTAIAMTKLLGEAGIPVTTT